MLNQWRLLIMIVVSILCVAACSDDTSVDGDPVNNPPGDLHDVGPGDGDTTPDTGDQNPDDVIDEDTSPIDDVSNEDEEPIDEEEDDCPIETSRPKWDEALGDYVADPCYCESDGPGWHLDHDQDGLTDCEEMELCTSPFNHDSDGDGLSDLEEMRIGTDPCNPDTDGDGLNDYDELLYGFDPNKPSTYDDGILDGDRWIVTACDNPTSENVNFFTSGQGGWKIALPPAFSNYQDVSITSATPQNRWAAAVYDDPATELAGFVFSTQPSAGQNSPVDVLLTHRPKIAALGTIQQDTTGGEFDTHDFRKAAMSRFLIRSTQAKSVRKMRDDLLVGLAPFGAADVDDLPAITGNTYNDFRLAVSVIHRGNLALTLLSLTPAQRFEEDDKVKFRMDDLTNTTNISNASDGDHVRCSSFKPGIKTPQADIYWVLDQSGSMYDDYDRVRDVANEFYAQLNNTPLDYRLGVANMSGNTDGKLRNPPAWHTDLATFLNEIEQYVIQCQGCTGDYVWAEYGLTNIQKGIEYMTSSAAPLAEQMRPGAEIITILMSDEEDQDIQDNPLSTATGQAKLSDFLNFFVGRTKVFSIVSQGWPCGDDAQAYMQVSLATGGSFYDLCADNIEETIEDIIFSATGHAASHTLSDTPISSSLRVFKNGQWVPRSRENGFDYFANTNSVAFFGSFRPDPNEEDPTDHVAISYKHYVVSVKE